MITRTVRVSLLILALVLFLASPYYSLERVWGCGAGLLLSVVNLVWLHRIFGALFGALCSGRKTQIWPTLLMKVFLFYGLVFSVFVLAPISAAAFAVGFSLPMGVILLKLLGRQMIAVTDRGAQGATIPFFRGGNV